MNGAATTGGPLAGRTAIVTGAGQGVGRGIALALAARGANVVIAARRAETGEPVAEEIRARGDEAVCIVTDVTSRAAVTACVEQTVERYGGLEIMVHNAYAGSKMHRVEDLDLDIWRTNSRTAVWGSLYCAAARVPAPARRRSSRSPDPDHVAVGGRGQREHPRVLAGQGCAARDGEEPVARMGTARHHRELHRARGGDARARRRLRDESGAAARVEERTSLRRIGDAESDIGGVAAFLASDDAGYVTGQTVVCDGGSFMGL